MDVYKAMADPTRRKILQLLNEKDYTAGEIASYFDMSKPAISKHLDILKSAELITSIKKGQYVIYSIHTSTIQDLLCSMMDMFGKKESKLEDEKI